jgi:hypothetical protein
MIEQRPIQIAENDVGNGLHCESSLRTRAFRGHPAGTVFLAAKQAISCGPEISVD